MKPFEHLKPSGISIYDVDCDLLPGTLLEAAAKFRDVALLESTAQHERFGRYSILTVEPLDVITLQSNQLTNSTSEILATGAEQVWNILSQAFETVQLSDCYPDVIYTPGWIGYLGYELGRFIEKLPENAPRDTDLPDLRLGFYDVIALFDHAENRWQIIQLDFETPPQNAGQSARSLRELLTKTCSDTPKNRAADPENSVNYPKNHPASTENLPLSNFTPDEYRRAVAKCVDYIAAGDIFQVNLSQRFEFHDPPASTAAYQHLRNANPAWYAAYLNFNTNSGEAAVVSCSPEMFLSCRGNQVITRPIKGTNPRFPADPKADQASKTQLINSEKDNAELAMIIDLLRNDLGRVCKFSSVKVSQARDLETHPTVFHLVGTVIGELCEGTTHADLLKATFPGGSITGAPKIRAMEIIDELEPAARSVYTGSVGIVCCNGNAEWNIAIRTIIYCNEKAYAQVGGGIVADSTPQGEYDETLHKAAAMFSALSR